MSKINPIDQRDLWRGMPKAVLAPAGQLISRKKLLLTREESESRDGSWSLAAFRMASQGETGQDTTSLSLDVMGTQAQTIISSYIIIRGAL